MKTFYTNAGVYRNGKFELGRIVVQDGHIAADCEPQEGDRVVDLRGLSLLPGLVDVHVHLREPGAPRKETIATGSAACAHGGYTTVCAMPNLNPAPDSVETLEQQLEIIRHDAKIHVIPYGCITMGQKGAGELVDFQSIADKVIGFSDDGRGVQKDELMGEAMRRVAKTGRPVVAHCEVDELLKGGYIHDGIYCKDHGHKGICSESEWREVERDIRLAAAADCQYHVCHVSTKESVQFVREAKARGERVSCETAPHYLLLTENDLQEEGRFKMNPPLRSEEDHAALVRGIQDGTIEVIATDHAPHTAEEKSRGLAGSLMGIVGIETAFPLLYTYLVKKGVISFEQLMNLLCFNPRRLFRIEGGIEVGDVADFTVMDLNDSYTIDPEEFLSKGRATPFAGWKVEGRTMLTVAGGEVAYKSEKLELK